VPSRLGRGKPLTYFYSVLIILCFFQGEEQIRQAELIKSRNCVHPVGVDYVQDDGFDK
jgi:hypothetical protein